MLEASVAGVAEVGWESLREEVELETRRRRSPATGALNLPPSSS